jgi:hypothetical protein
MGAGDIEFPIAMVHRHGGTVDRVADAMEMARSAVHEVSMDTQAYGQLCQFLPAILSPVFGLAVDAIHESVGSLQETAQKLRTAATATQQTDVGRSEQITAIGTAHPGLRLAL